MNKSYRVIFNHERNAWVAVAEITPAKGKSSCKSIVSTTVHAAVISAATIGATIAPTSVIADTWEATSGSSYTNTTTGETFSSPYEDFSIKPIKKATYEGSAGFFEFLGDDEAVKIVTGQTGNTELYAQSQTKLGAENDATSIDNMRKAIDSIELVNSLRSQDDSSIAEYEHNYGVTSKQMAMAQIHANLSSRTGNHADIFPVEGENLSFAYGIYKDGAHGKEYSALGGLYDKEKARFDDPKDPMYHKCDFDWNTGSGTAHYCKIVDGKKIDGEDLVSDDPNHTNGSFKAMGAGVTGVNKEGLPGDTTLVQTFASKATQGGKLYNSYGYGNLLEEYSKRLDQNNRLAPQYGQIFLSSNQVVNIKDKYSDNVSIKDISVFGGYSPNGKNANNNTVNIKGTVGLVYGGYSLGGEVSNNTVNIEGTEVATVWGGYGGNGSLVSGNTVNLNDGSAVQIFGGNGVGVGVKASNNTVMVAGRSDVFQNVYGAKGSDLNGNTVTIAENATIYGNVYGADGEKANHNTVTIKDDSTIKGNVYGAYREYSSGSSHSHNTVNIEGGTVEGHVMGTYFSGPEHTVNIKGGTVQSVYLTGNNSNNDNAQNGKEFLVTSGAVNLLSDSNSVTDDIYGVVSIANKQSNPSDVNNREHRSYTGKTFYEVYDIALNLGAQNKRIPMNTYKLKRVGAFTEYNFYLPSDVKNKDVALETDKLLFRRKDVDVNVYIPGDAALEQNDTVYLIKTTTFKDQDPNITGNVYQGVTLQNNLGEVKIDDKDLILSMLKDNTSSTTPDPVPDPKVWNVSPNTYTTDVNETPASFNGNFNAAKNTSGAMVNVLPNDDYKGIDVYGAKDNGTTNIAGAKNLGGIIDESNTSILNIDASKGSVQANSVKGWKEINFSNLSEKDPALALTQKADFGNKIKLSGSLNDYKKDGATFTLVKSENQVNVSDELFAENQITGKEFDILSSTQYKVDEFGFHQDADKKSLYINTENTKKNFNGDFKAAKDTSKAIVNVLPNDDYKGISIYGAKDNGTTNIAGAKNLGGIIDESNTSTLNIDASKGSVQANSVKGWKEINFSNLSEKDPALALTQKADLGNKIKLSGSLNDYNQKGLTFTLVKSENQVNVSDKLFAENRITGNEFDILSSTQYKVDEFGFHQDANKKSLYINTEKTVKAIQDKQFNGADGIKNAIININTTGDFNGLNINAADKDSTINYVWGRNLGVIDGKNGTLNIGTENKATAMNQRSAVDIKNIGDLNFYLPENIKNEDTALSLSATDKTDLSKTAVTAYLSGDSQINDKDVVHLIKKTNGGEISINDSNNKVTVKQGITLTSTQEMKLSDNKQNLDLIFAKASQDNEQPQGGNEQPQGGNEKPQGGNEQPQGGNEQPQGGNEQPQGGNEQPQGG
ncbi:MAG: hypothetical protein IJR46_04500, partial [Neisseriaceae bacterium]|nr:hypothetical protein [Neisseriaceae bacterium]